MSTGQTVLSAAERSIRSVFVGNIPYEATEEQLKDIFSEVGPVVSFRLVYDRETGKPKGYGFCEYKDQETALSAMRNLNAYELNGRALRVDNAASEKSKEELKNLQNTLGGPPVESPYGPEVDPSEAPQAIAKVMATLPPIRMYELMKEMKLCIQNHPNESRNLLLQNPQLAYALLQGTVVMKIVDPSTAASFLHPHAFTAGPSISTSQPEQPVQPPQAAHFGNMAQNAPVDMQHMNSSAVPSVPNMFNPQGREPARFPGVPPVPTQPQDSIGINMPRDIPPGAQMTPFIDHPVGLNNNPRQPIPAPPIPPNFTEKGQPGFPNFQEIPAMGDHDMRQPPIPLRPPVGDRDMREPPFSMEDKDMRSVTTDQDLRTMSLSQIVVEKLCPEAQYPRPPGLQPSNQFAPQVGHQPTVFDQRHSFPPPSTAPAEVPPMQSGQQKQAPRLGGPVPSKSPVVSQAQAPSGASPGLPSSAALLQAASNLIPNDQEKASLILQVLQLSDQQIAVLPPEQRQSILILKEQFLRAAQGT